MEQDVIVSEAGLPFKFGNYADTFIGFHRDLGTELMFCSCQREAVEKNIEMGRIYAEATRRHDQLGWFLNAHSDYPEALWKATSIVDTLPIHALPRFMRFADQLCHRCNERMPYGYYAYSDSASGYFISHFRPYVNQACYAAGITPNGQLALPDACPDAIKNLSDQARRDLVEAQVRQAFGFPPKGINRNQESKLSLLVRQILPDCKVIRHYRPAWLEGLELDLFVEEHNLGIEFQGVQHSQPFEYLGGEVALRKTRRRDNKKARLCKELGVKLVLVEEGAELSEDAIRAKLKKAVPSIETIPRQQIERPPYMFAVPVDGSTLHWSYHDDKNELSVSGKIAGADFYTSGSPFDVFVSYKSERVISLRLSVRKHGASSAITWPMAGDDQPQYIVIGRDTKRPMLDFFKVWSMFNPRVVVHEAERKDASADQ